MIQDSAVRSLDIAAVENGILILSPSIWKELIKLLPAGDNRNESILQVVVPGIGPCAAIKERGVSFAHSDIDKRTNRIGF